MHESEILSFSDFEATIRFNRTLLLPVWETPPGEIRGEDRVITVTGVTGESDTLALLEFMALLENAAQTPLVIDSFEDH